MRTRRIERMCLVRYVSSLPGQTRLCEYVRILLLESGRQSRAVRGRVSHIGRRRSARDYCSPLRWL